MMELYTIVALGLLGLCFGSFAGAADWRIKVKKDMVHDRSECESCHHKLSALDLVPLFSWLWLRGKCRYCKKPISIQNPLLELGMATYFVGSYLLWPVPLAGAYEWFDFVLWLVYGVMGAILFVYDLKWQLLPDRIVKPLIALGALDFVVRAVQQKWSYEQFFGELILALASIAGLYWVLHYISKGAWVGFGDVKLGIFMGLALGWQHALLALFAANFIGVLVILPGLALGTLTRKSKVPFGPFLLAGFVVAGLFGDDIVRGYFENLDLLVTTLML